MIPLLYFAALIGGTGSAETPLVLENVEAVYPPAALSDRVEATVVLRLGVDTEGRVEDVSVIATATRADELSATAGSTTSYSFAESAVEAARRMRFSPWVVDDQAVAFELDYTVHFQLPPRPVPEPAAIAAPINLRGVVRRAGVRRR